MRTSAQRRTPLKDFHLRFARNDIANLHAQSDADAIAESGWYDNSDYAMFDLVGGKIDDVPDEPGAYVFGTADNTMLVYPWGLSPIYYIGQAQSLRARLSDHCKATLGAMDADETYWRPRYQYGAAFGAHVVWYLARGLELQNFEATLITSFYDTYGAQPIANGSWPQWPNIPSTASTAAL